jgi:predicted ATPase
MPLLTAVIAAQHVGTSLLGIIRRIRVRIVAAVASGADCAVEAPRARREQPFHPVQEEEAALTKAAATRPAPVDGAAGEPARHAVLFEELGIDSAHVALVPLGARVA